MAARLRRRAGKNGSHFRGANEIPARRRVAPLPCLSLYFRRLDLKAPSCPLPRRPSFPSTLMYARQLSAIGATALRSDHLARLFWPRAAAAGNGSALQNFRLLARGHGRLRGREGGRERQGFIPTTFGLSWPLATFADASEQVGVVVFQENSLRD